MICERFTSQSQDDTMRQNILKDETNSSINICVIAADFDISQVVPLLLEIQINQVAENTMLK